MTSGDGIYSAEVVFPTGTYKFLEYKYFCASGDTTGTYECDGLPDRSLTLDDVKAAAAEYLHPEGLTMLFVGDQDKFEQPLSNFGEVNVIELPE